MKIPGFGNGYAVAWSLEPWKINIKKKKTRFFLIGSLHSILDPSPKITPFHRRGGPRLPLRPCRNFSTCCDESYKECIY